MSKDLGDEATDLRSQSVDPLDPDVLSVLRKASPAEVDSASRARVLAGVEARIALLPSGGGGGGESSGGGRGSGISRLIASKPALSLALAFVAGGGAGALLRGAPSPKLVIVERAVPASVQPSAPPSASAIAAPSSSVATEAIDADALPSASASPRTNAAPLDSGAALAAESALLDIARTALARGEPDHALAATARHAAQFPHGLLVEEREALAVKALAQAGRGADARARADRFHARYPKSMFQTAIDSSLESVHEMDPARSRQP